MPALSFQITCPEELADGVTFVREQFNAGLPTLVQDGEVQDGFEEDGVTPHLVPNMVPNPELILTDADYCAKRFALVFADWKRQRDAAFPPPPPPPPPPVTADVTSVPRRQAIQALINRNKKAAVEAVIAAMPETTEAERIAKETMDNEYRNSQVFERDRATSIQMCAAVGITDRVEWWNYASTL